MSDPIVNDQSIATSDEKWVASVAANIFEESDDENDSDSFQDNPLYQRDGEVPE